MLKKLVLTLVLVSVCCVVSARVIVKGQVSHINYKPKPYTASERVDNLVIPETWSKDK